MKYPSFYIEKRREEKRREEKRHYAFSLTV
jgi:hypothetical protein